MRRSRGIPVNDLCVTRLVDIVEGSKPLGVLHAKYSNVYVEGTSFTLAIMWGNPITGQ